MLDSYWPDVDAVNACIKNEAETADDSVLLAVHQPAAIVRRAEGSEVITPATEQDLLDAFTTENVPGGYVLLPITGVSGAGKSHIVRWLDAQLQGRTWVCGDRYSLADILLLGFIEFGASVGQPMPAAATWLPEWHKRAAARPSAAA